MAKTFNASSFRKELIETMPGYKWTVHRNLFDDRFFSATGIQSIGLNRMSTLSVIRRDRDGQVEYEVKSAGFGRSAPWLATSTRTTLARALRALQSHYEAVAANYSRHARDLQDGREKPKE